MDLMLKLQDPHAHVLFVVAHPHDEVIGAGGSLLSHFEHSKVVYVTDGAPANMLDAQRAGFVAKMNTRTPGVKNPLKRCRSFPIDVERFREAPEYDFTQPPHEGRLHYEYFDWGMTGDRWRSLASEAEMVLRQG